MKAKKIIVELTDRQAELISWALKAGLEQHEKFLRHDDWDDPLTARERHAAMWPDRAFAKAIKTFDDKIKRARGKRRLAR